MPNVACIGCSHPLKFSETPPEGPFICDACRALLVKQPPAGGQILPDFPTPKALRTLRIFEPPEQPKPPAPPSVIMLLVLLVAILALVGAVVVLVR